jgi:hypothetical protein
MESCEITGSNGNFQGLWEGWKQNSFIVLFPPFPSDRHFHRNRFRCVVGSVNTPRIFLVACFFAVIHYLCFQFAVLLRFDESWRARSFCADGRVGVAQLLLSLIGPVFLYQA